MPKSRRPVRSSRTQTQPTRLPHRATLPLLMMVMIINALAYGTIIPLLYPYAARFGISPLGMSLMFASFSLAQFLATPFLGRLSDRYGRKPVLLICLTGTALSLGMFAAATNVVMLFLARMIDGVTGGNISVAQAMIADTSDGPERAKRFGILGASFGLGFLLGPAIGGILSGYSLQAPFWFGAGLAACGAVLGVFLLPETLATSRRQKASVPLFQLKSMYQALFLPLTGAVLVLSLVSTAAFNGMVIGFQAYTVDVLKLNTTQIGIFFSCFGLLSMLVQVVGIGVVQKQVKSKRLILTTSYFLSAITIGAAYFTTRPETFFAVMMGFAVVGAFRDPMVLALLSERTKSEDQGGIMGINQSYVAVGQILGPLAAGAVSTFSVQSVFLFAGGLLALATLGTRWLYVGKHAKLDL